ncbi:MAG: hypothetical protein RMK97_10930 [Sutterellaceae bacterium]|nr:hypothetical protein [Burkholderiaceae bacterium]MCX7902232.1 hypothetical protein [Burkholderiaceae bacterium]MDW8430993.1 hypothetical protein [Sutterellaceae bacterium]
MPTPSPTPAPTPTPSPPPPAASHAWVINPWPYFVIGQVTTYDLAATLPPGVARGGTFGVDPNGERLPEGMTLSPAGILSLGSATVGQTTGVIFTYTEPGS